MSATVRKGPWIAATAVLLVVLALAPDGNLGKARYLLRRYALAIREEL